MLIKTIWMIMLSFTANYIILLLTFASYLCLMTTVILKRTREKEIESQVARFNNIEYFLEFHPV